MYIYQIINLINNKRYIGQSIKSNDDRWHEHKSLLKHNIHYNKKLQHAWNKYRENNFKFEMLVICNSKEELNILEMKNILEHNSIKNGYNISEGGQIGKTYSKGWSGVKSPDGTIYPYIENMSNFCRQFKLDADKMRQVSRGTRFSYKGWTTLARTKGNNFHYSCDRRPSKESNVKRSISVKKSWNARKIEQTRRVTNG